MPEQNVIFNLSGEVSLLKQLEALGYDHMKLSSLECLILNTLQQLLDAVIKLQSK